MNNCFQVTVLSWLLHLGWQHLYKITQIYKNRTGNTFTNVLTFCKTAKGLIGYSLNMVHNRHPTMLLVNSTTAIPLSPNNYCVAVSRKAEILLFISRTIHELMTRTTVFCRVWHLKEIFRPKSVFKEDRAFFSVQDFSWIQSVCVWC